MKRRIGIIGTGWVGSSVAIAALRAGLADELLLHDLRTAVAEGDAMELAHGAAFYPPATVRSAAVVISAGRGGRTGESRLDLLRDNAAVARDLGRRLAGCRGVVVVVTNPVDVLTRVAVEAYGLPPARVLGTGTMLDTARLRLVLGRELRVDAHSVHAMVVGEHGDSGVPLWSGVRVGGVPLPGWPGWDAGRQPRLAEEVRTAANQIIARKGATNHAIGLVTADLLRAVLRDEGRVLTVSRVQEGAAGVSGDALSLPAVVHGQGTERVLEPAMTAEEREQLARSAAVLNRAAAEMGRPAEPQAPSATTRA